MTGWTVLWRGVKYRATRSWVVLLLAAVATTSAAVLPAYVRGAQQSILRDMIQSATADQTAMHVTVAAGPGQLQAPGVKTAQATVESVIKGEPELHSRTSGFTSQVDARLRLRGKAPATVVNGRFAYRDDFCAHVSIEGRCAGAEGEVMVSARTAQLHGIKVGDEIDLEAGQAAEIQTRKPKVTGLYTAKDTSSSYWHGTGLLAFGAIPEVTPSGSEIFTIDAVMVHAPLEVESLRGELRRKVTAWIALDDVDMNQMEQVSAALTATVERINDMAMLADSRLALLIDRARVDQDAIATTVPIGAVPLLVLALFVLMVLVAALAEERGPEIALAKLHGYAASRVGQFGLGEVLFLITLAAPVGLALAWAVMLAVKLLWFAEGTPLELMWQPFAAVAAAVVLTYLSAIAASRRIFSTRIIQLLRKVPQRTTWKAGALEGAIVALTLAALAAAVQDRSSGLGLVVAPLVAVVGGLIGGRILSFLSKSRLPRARRAADVSGLLASAQLSRRPGRQRIIVVIAIATSLMGFAATAWDVASQARAAAANGEVGAQKVYRATAPDAQRLLAAVQTAVPDGSAMAVARREEYYDGRVIRVLGVQSDRLAGAATWLGHTNADLLEAAKKLKPPVAEPYLVSGTVTAQITADGFAGVPLELEAQVELEGGGIKRVKLGTLKTGTHDYSAAVPSGTLLSFQLSRRPADFGKTTGVLILRSLSSSSGPLVIGGEQHWSAPVNADVKVGLLGTDELEARIESQGNRDIHLGHLRTPKALPALLTGSAPVQRGSAETWTFPALGIQPQLFTVAQQVTALPGAGSGTGFLVDLAYAAQSAVDSEGLARDQVAFEVWAGPDAPADLRQRLSAQGVELQQVQTLTAYADQLGRRAPALALRIYALAGLVAVLLSLGIVVLVARIGAEQRAFELAALRVAGVPVKSLRRALRREYLTLLGWPSLIGFAAGIGSSLFMLPAIPLVTVGVTTAVQWQPAPGALAALAAAAIGCLLVALPVSVRLVRAAKPELLRGEA